MKMWLGCTAAVALLAAPSQVLGGELRLSIANGRVTIVAQDVTVKQILDEWGRVGQTTVVGADKLAGGLVSLELRDVAEARALESLLRSASGYIAKPRGNTAGASEYDRILIMPASRAPAVTAVAPAINRRPQPQFVNPVIDDDVEPNPIMPPGAVPMPQPYPGQPPMQPGQQPPMQPGQQMPMQPGQQTPMTSPRPGQLPPPAPGMPGSPYPMIPGGQPLPIRPPGVPGAQGPGGFPVQPASPQGPGGGGH
jgi:hypothetical protein